MLTLKKCIPVNAFRLPIKTYGSETQRELFDPFLQNICCFFPLAVLLEIFQEVSVMREQLKKKKIYSYERGPSKTIYIIVTVMNTKLPRENQFFSLILKLVIKL